MRRVGLVLIGGRADKREKVKSRNSQIVFCESA
jgi:hypothetical protein